MVAPNPLSLLFALAVAASIVAAPASARADDAQVAATPPDIVRLKNGGMVRGTILESVPNDRVDIQMPNGQTRRIPWADVDYAGPACAAASAPAPAPGVPVQFDGDADEELRIYLPAGEVRVTGTAGAHVFVADARSFAPLCLAPCRTQLDKGIHRLALSRRGEAPIQSENAVRIGGPARLRGHYVSHSALRAIGWTTLAVGTAGGAAVTMVGASQPGGDVRVIVSGAILTAGSLFLGLVMGLQRDEVWFGVSPLTVASLRREGTIETPAGAELRLRF